MSVNMSRFPEAFLRPLVFLVICLCLVVPGRVEAEPVRVYPDVAGLYQRVAVNPGGKLADAPGGSEIARPDAFTVFYVFGRQPAGGDDWLEVGSNPGSDPLGWIREAEVTPLRHMLVLGPQTRQNRERALYFDTLGAIRAVATDPDRVGTYIDYVKRAGQGNIPQGSGIVGIQPENQPSMHDAFSFMPIRSVERALVPGLGNSQFFETLSVPLPPQADANSDFRTGVVFVVDTTSSMGPYIDRTRSMMSDLYKSLRSSGDPDQISFGLVAFRDNMQAIPELGYVTKTAHPLRERFDGAGFDRAIAALEEAPVSSAGFEEDAVAGLVHAMRMDGWDAFERRVIILVTDAGMRAEADPLSTTQLDLDVVAREAEEKRISIASIYLDTPAGADRKRGAIRQHSRISRWQNGDPQLIEVTDGDFNAFQTDIARLTRGITDLLDDGPDCSQRGSLSDVDKVLCEIEDRTKAVRIEWLGVRDDIPAEAVASGWVTDISLDSRSGADRAFAFKPYILLTRDQMNDLVIVLDSLLTTAGGDITSNREKVLNVFKDALARGAVDPEIQQAAVASGGNAADLFTDDSEMSALLPAFLAELPLKSHFMQLKASSWINPNEQSAHMLEIRRKVIEYRDYLSDRDRWIALAEDAPDSEWVYPVPWDRIP